MTWLIDFKDYFEALSYLAVLFGVPVGIYSYIKTAKSEKQDREYGTYNALDEKYIEFQALCLQNPRLDIFDVSDGAPATDLTDIEKKQELIAFTMLFSIFERAYLMYHDQDSEIKLRQWTGWNDYIIDFCQRENFRAAWSRSGETFDTRYQEFMSQTLVQCLSERPETARATAS